MIKSRDFVLLMTAVFFATGLFGQAHVIITAGQSNTDGRVPNRDLPGYIKALSTDPVAFKTGAYKFCKIAQNRADGKFVPFYPSGRITKGLWAYDAVTYYKLGQALQEDFYVIKYAVGGTSIQHPKQIPPSGKGRYWSADPDFLKSTSSFETGGHSLLLSLTDAIDASIDQTLSKLKEGYQIDAFLWHQGESDGAYGRAYYDNLKRVIAYVRRHLSEKTGEDYSRLPFIFGSIPESNRDYSPLVEMAMKRIAQEDPDAYLVDMHHGALQKDRLHFTAASATYLGTQMYGILAKIMALNRVGFRVAKYLDDKRAAISFTFDDGLAEQATLAAPHFDQLGFKATFFINGRSISDTTANGGKPRMSWDQLRDLAKQGHEIASHGWQHRNFGKFSLAEIRRDIDKNDSAIYAELGVKPLTFAYANNTKEAESMVEVYKHHIASRLLQISLGSKWTAEDLERRLQHLLANRGWQVTMTHGITYGYDHFKDPSILWNYLKRVKSLEGKIWVGTFCQVAAYITERKAITFSFQPSRRACNIIPEIHLDKRLYTMPLTGVIELRGRTKMSIAQQGRQLETRVENGAVLFEFGPFGGTLLVEWE